MTPSLAPPAPARPRAAGLLDLRSLYLGAVLVALAVALVTLQWVACAVLGVGAGARLAGRRRLAGRALRQAS